MDGVDVNHREHIETGLLESQAQAPGPGKQIDSDGALTSYHITS